MTATAHRTNRLTSRHVLAIPHNTTPQIPCSPQNSATNSACSLMRRTPVSPGAGLAYVSIDTDSFRERGGAQASLRGSALDQDVGYSTLGLRAATTMHWGATLVTPHVSAAWQHAFDDVTPGASLAFATTGIGFGIDGVPLAQDTALIGAGLDFALGPNTTAGVSYTGQFGDGVSDNAVRGRLTWLF